MGPDSGRKVRIVARIRGFSTREVEAQPRVLSWVSVSRANENSSSGVTVSFQSDQTSSARQSYEVDECFELDAGTDVIFSKEIKPLISGVFEGRHATVFAYGARGSGKTFTIQGSEDQQGLAALAMSSILSYAEVVGKSVTISLYEVYQDHVFDLLNSSRPEVSIFEDGHGRITLKGLSEVKVTTMAEFQNLHIRGVTVPKQSRWSHKGLIVRVVSSPTENSNGLLVGKLNFVDLAGYEDPRRKNNEESKLVEISRTNKTMYAVHNVLRALNAGETRVPYRESRLTRILQDSLGGLHKILMIACINPSICLETVQAVSLACRSCKASNGSLPVLSKSSKSATKPIAMSSSKIMRSTVAARTNMVCSPRVTKSISTSASAQKPARSELQSSLKKAKGATFSGKRRMLFNEANQWKSSEQGSICSESASATGTSQEEEGNSHLQRTSASEYSPKDKEKYALDVFSEAQSSQIAPVEEEKYAVDAFSEAQSSQIAPVEEEEVAKAVHNHETSTPAAYHTPATVSFSFEEKENNSPPLSTRLRELSNSLKSLCHSSGSTLKMSNYEHMEPKTPVGRADTNKIEFLGIKSPWEKFHTRSSGMKDSFVQEYLKFLNSASKDELKGLKGIGEKRASYILELREESPEPFKDLDDLKDIGLSAKQIKGMMKKAAGDLFN